MKKYFVLACFISILLIAPLAMAAEKMIFDSTNDYRGACQLTDKSEWELTKDLNVTKFQIWYSWNQDETTLPVTVYKDGKEFAKFDAKKGDCDTYQKQWCNADYKINEKFPKGKYSTEIPNARQCLKPGSTGTVRLYGEETGEETATGTVTTTKEEVGCEKSCALPIVITAVVTLIATFVLSFFVFRKK